MAKDKTKTGVPNKHLHARISFLQQAATCLTLQAVEKKHAVKQNEHLATPRTMPAMTSPTTSTETQADANLVHSSDGSSSRPLIPQASGGLPLLLSSHLMQVARKSQIRLHPNIKHQICKRCQTVLSEGTTSRKSIENLSKDGKKAHADVLVVECTTCRVAKRWPIGASRQQKKSARQKGQSTNVKKDDEREERHEPKQ